MRCFFYLYYDGSQFLGWQRQAKGRTVQAVLEDAVQKLLGGAGVDITASGRTDAGVHAVCQVAHADLPDDTDLAWLAFRLNALLPDDLGVRQIRPVRQDASARFSAVERAYVYQISQQKPVLARPAAYWAWGRLDLDAMNQAASYLVGRHSFTSFAKTLPPGEHYQCHIIDARFESMSEDFALPEPFAKLPLLRFHVRANRFLRGQVRAMVGALLEVGVGKQASQWIGQLLAEERPQLSASLAPPQGLFLCDVVYPQDIFLDL